ncbi:MAG: type III secretion system export apparatus subunit SctV [Chlamydiia bacterium]
MSMLGNFARRLGSERVLAAIAKSSDIVLAAWIVLIIGVLIIQVPPTVIDFLIAINLTISISLLMVALYIPKATHLSIFPSLLLITTLYRVSIEVASTKQILLHAYAGHIIYAFGRLVVGGSFVVGGIIFLIITIVQFIVVVKGSERVAEVAARFSLDGMPGKQMSIDADLRSGVIDANQARELRGALQKESQLYGAMDGAMKFVKGDAIAGIVITTINIIGGLIIGVSMRGMSAYDAAQTYAILSIGSGLVSQIPALLISVTAGIVTTRVSSDKKDANLGRDISSQLRAQPKALILAAIMVFSLGLIPGFARIPFFIMGGLIGGIQGYYIYKAWKLRAAGGTAPETDAEGNVVEQEEGEYALTMPVILEAGSGLSHLLVKEKAGRAFTEEQIPKLRNALYQDLGVRFPAVHVRPNSANLQDWEYMVLLNEVPVVKAKVLPKHLLTGETEQTLKRYNIPFTSYSSGQGMPTLWVEDKYADILTKANLKYWDTLQILALHLTQFYRQYSAEFLGIQEVRAMLAFIEKSFPDLVKEVSRLIPLQKLTDIFKRLVQEEISIKDLRTILEALGENAQTEKDVINLTEFARESLKRYISYKYSQGQSTLAVYVVDPEIEDMIAAAIKQTSTGSRLGLDPDTLELIKHAIRSAIKPVPAGGQPPLVLTGFTVRRFVKRLVETEFPNAAVISYQEVLPEIRIQPLGRIQIV